MSVRDIGFLLDRLGADCHPLQFLRELTQNAIEAIGRSGKPGEIIWDMDWNMFDLEGQKKLCVIDTGDGMTGEEMLSFINQLSSSINQKSFVGNFGVGAKIAAATRNHAGVVYLSWKDGAGSMIHLQRDTATGQYGLRQWRRADGSYGHYLPIENDVKPAVIDQHGTMVVLLGGSKTESTMTAPLGSAAPSRWISKYLNTRYFRFPRGVTLKAREGWEFPREDSDRNYLRTLIGQEEYLDKYARASGNVAVDRAKVRWWILKEDPPVSQNSGFIESSGHCAALYRDELYELASGRSGMSRLQQFGITFGYRWVVLYVEPIEDSGAVLTSNTARTSLLLGGEPLPWAEWAAEFREKLPDELRTFVEQKAAKSASSDHSGSIRDRLKDLLDLYKVSRYRPTSGGTTSVDDEQLVPGGVARLRQRSTASGGSQDGGQGGTAGNVYAIFEKKGGSPARQVRPDLFPDVRWVSVQDGTREYGDIEDRAAKFLIDPNILLANGDFRGFLDMEDHIVSDFGDEPGLKTLAREAVRGWFEQALVETVLGVQGLRNSKEWSRQDIESALSEEALTAAVMQRYHVYLAARREVGAKTSRQAKKAS